jgi:hypothetical protein
MFFRMALRLLLYAGETNLYQNLAAQTQPSSYSPQAEELGAQGLSFASE